jgi:NitT/TauT family transport system substrate-binding protein
VIPSLRTVSALGALVALAVLAAPAQALEKVSFSLASTIDGRSGAILLAYDRGYFKDLGLDVDIVPGNGSANVVNRLASGTFQMGSGDIASVIKFDMLNPDKLVKAVYNEKLADLVIVTLKGRGITQPMDLKGRTVGAPTGDTAYKMFAAFSGATGVKADDIKWEHMDMTIREAMLVQGKVDAITASWASAFFNLKSLGVAENDMIFLRYADYGVNIVGNGWMANESFIKEHPDTVRKMLAAFNHGWRDTLADPNAALDSVFKREPLLKRDLEMSKLIDAAHALTDQPDAKAGGVGSYSDKTIEYTMGVVSAAENINAKIPVSDVIDLSFLPPLSERQLSAPKTN